MAGCGCNKFESTSRRPPAQPCCKQSSRQIACLPSMMSRGFSTRKYCTYMNKSHTTVKDELRETALPSARSSRGGTTRRTTPGCIAGTGTRTCVFAVCLFALHVYVRHRQQTADSSQTALLCEATHHCHGAILLLYSCASNGKARTEAERDEER
jgi:hypothetical protein